MADRMSDDLSMSYLTWGGAALVVIALMATTFATTTGIGVARVAPVIAGESRELTMVDSGDGGVVVTDLAEPARTWIARPSNGEGFVQIVHQGMMRARVMAGVDTRQPFRLVRQPDGRLWLQDTSTQQQLAIDAFGPVSARAFVKFLDDGKARQ